MVYKALAAVEVRRKESAGYPRSVSEVECGVKVMLWIFAVRLGAFWGRLFLWVHFLFNVILP